MTLVRSSRLLKRVVMTEREIIDLAMKYTVLTKFTGFVGADNAIREPIMSSMTHVNIEAVRVVSP